MHMHSVELGWSVANLSRAYTLDQTIGDWAIDPCHYESASKVGWSRVGDSPGARTALVPTVERGGSIIALVGLIGPLIKYGLAGNAQTSSVYQREVIKALGRDETIDAIMLVIDSPGGTVAGTVDLADAVRDVAKIKPVVAHIDELAASAAYWVASQASTIFASNSAAQAGSIGVFVSVLDAHRAFESAGLESVVIKTGPFKGIGIFGAEITEEHRAYVQRRINETGQLFKVTVATGRGMSYTEVDDAATGGTFAGAEAIRRKLIDGVIGREEVLEIIGSGAR